MGKKQNLNALLALIILLSGSGRALAADINSSSSDTIAPLSSKSEEKTESPQSMITRLTDTSQSMSYVLESATAIIQNNSPAVTNEVFAKVAAQRPDLSLILISALNKQGYYRGPTPNTPFYDLQGSLQQSFYSYAGDGKLFADVDPEAARARFVSLKGTVDQNTFKEMLRLYVMSTGSDGYTFEPNTISDTLRFVDFTPSSKSAAILQEINHHLKVSYLAGDSSSYSLDNKISVMDAKFALDRVYNPANATLVSKYDINGSGFYRLDNLGLRGEPYSQNPEIFTFIEGKMIESLNSSPENRSRDILLVDYFSGYNYGGFEGGEINKGNLIDVSNAYHYLKVNVSPEFASEFIDNTVTYGINDYHMTYLGGVQGVANPSLGFVAADFVAGNNISLGVSGDNLHWNDINHNGIVDISEVTMTIDGHNNNI